MYFKVSYDSINDMEKADLSHNNQLYTETYYLATLGTFSQPKNGLTISFSVLFLGPHHPGGGGWVEN